MRKWQKESILSVLGEFSAVLERILALEAADKRTSAQNALSELQDYIEGIQEIIEEKEENTHKLLGKIYMELFHIYERISDHKEIREAIKNLSMLITQTISCIGKLPVKIEVLFLPYKASMWDSMESIWEMARQDPDCDSYVVPIPFYERSADHMIPCYEGNELPGYVPITHYTEYTIGARKPDIIIIHNPFDDYNLVTQVQPEYFSNELKKHTQLLVYVPYFFTGLGPMPESQMDLPVYRYADYVVLQDEEKKNSLLQTVDNKKLVALGSPKIDRLLKAQKNKDIIWEKDVPGLWKSKVKNKKIFFYNYSLSGVLENRQYAMSKLQYVLSRFENRKDAVIIWRPHPLLEATLKSMCPEIYLEYIKIKEEYLYKDYGILDETADNLTSVIISDAYIGESTSSMVHYFGVLGKPVFYTEWKVISEKSIEERARIPFTLVTSRENDILLKPFNLGGEAGLFRIDLTTGRLYLEEEMHGLDLKEGAYYGIAEIGEYVVLAPHCTGEIYIYNRNTHNAVKLPFRKQIKGQLFYDIITYNGCAYLIPACYPAIVRVNPSTLVCFEYNECLKEVLPDSSGEIIFYWHTKVIVNDRLYLFSGHTDKMLIFDFLTEEYETVILNGCYEGYNYAYFDGMCVWLTGNDTNLYCYDLGKGKTDFFLLPWEEGERKKICSLWGNELNIYIFNFTAERILIFNKLSGTFNFVVPPIKHKDTIVYITEVNNDKLYLINWSKGNLIEYSISENRWKETECRFNYEQLLGKERYETDFELIHEGAPSWISEDDVGISRFIDYISFKDFQKTIKNDYLTGIPNADGSCGQEIYTFIKNELHCITEE